MEINHITFSPSKPVSQHTYLKHTLTHQLFSRDTLLYLTRLQRKSFRENVFEKYTDKSRTDPDRGDNPVCLCRADTGENKPR